MKIHKRFAPSISRPLAAASSTAPSSPSVPSRVRSNSASGLLPAASPSSSTNGASSGARSLYTAASSPFGFFDSPPSVNVTPAPPTSARPGSSSSNLIVSTRLAAEVKAELEPHSQPQHQQQNNSSAPHQHGSSSSGSSGGGPPPYSLVFSSTNNQPDVSNLSGHHLQAHYQLLFPNYGHLPFGAVHPSTDSSVAAANDGILIKAGNKRQRLRYHLDVGAYGIPKHSRKAGAVAGRDGFTVGGMPQCANASTGLDGSSTSSNGKSLAVQVGEDAYFIRENAMGVADGVGGWAKARARGKGEFWHFDPHECSFSLAFRPSRRYFNCRHAPGFLTRVGTQTDIYTQPKPHPMIRRPQPYLLIDLCTTAAKRSRQPLVRGLGAIPLYRRNLTGKQKRLYTGTSSILPAHLALQRADPFLRGPPDHPVSMRPTCRLQPICTTS